MSIKKIIVYQKDASKPVILTDESDQPLSELKTKILDVFNSNKIYVLETQKDLLIGRSSEIQSILVSENKNISENIDDKKEIINSSTLDDKKAKYKKGLEINGANTNSN